MTKAGCASEAGKFSTKSFKSDSKFFWMSSNKDRPACRGDQQRAWKQAGRTFCSVSLPCVKNQGG